jgi:hypothetical protein|tara:strand:+ start:1329 stop:1820 length:492 start_codon:yes stop_codon:yes gene_type:complete
MQLISSRIPIILLTFLSISSFALSFDVAGLKLGDPISTLESLDGLGKKFLTVTHDPEGKIVRIFYRQEDLANDVETQAKLVNQICEKYGRKFACDYALSEIESTDGSFTSFYQRYRNQNKTQELNAQISRTKIISLKPKLFVEIDLVDTAYGQALLNQKSTDQ